MLTLLTLSLLAAEPPKDAVKLAAPALTLIDLDPKLKGFYTDHLAQQLRFQGVQVSTDADIAAVLGLERKQQLMGCSDDSCKAALGIALGVDGLVLGTVTKLDRSYKMDLRVVAAGTARVLATASTSTGDTDQLVGSIVVIAEQLARQTATALNKTLAPSASAQIVRGATMVKRLSWVPAVLGVAAFGAGAYEYAQARGSYEKLTTRQSPLLTKAEADAAAAQGNAQQTMGMVGFGVGAVALVAAGTMFLLGGDELITTGVAVTPTQASFVISGAFP